mmetsp:Transcript_18377/g.38443  ORF Transcript_18377/g.38443 Transcript_18377/m.38443 type:complete len:121 (+) Transcript_18377:903-1265(+)
MPSPVCRRSNVCVDNPANTEQQESKPCYHSEVIPATCEELSDGRNASPNLNPHSCGASYLKVVPFSIHNSDISTLREEEKGQPGNFKPRPNPCEYCIDVRNTKRLLPSRDILTFRATAIP